jgi:CHAD domain-containing protein
MGRNTKWVEGQPDESVELVARRALAARLGRLWHFLEQAVEHEGQQIEDVHQLRVFTRRSAAAMRIFEAWLPKRRGRWMHKQLKRIRKAAGEARDLDVLRARWSEELTELPAGQSAILLEQVKRRRRRAQWPIEDAYHKLASKRFPRRARKLSKKVRFRGPEGGDCGDRLLCVARVSLAELLVPYFQLAGSTFADPAELHAFRIASKQVRYAMEVFAGAFDDSFRQQLYPLVADLQDRLGKINDHVTALAYLTTWHGETEAAAVRQAIEAGMQLEQQALDDSQREFLAWWSAEKREQLHSQFARYVPLDPPPAHAIEARA